MQKWDLSKDDRKLNERSQLYLILEGIYKAPALLFLSAKYIWMSAV